MTIFLKWLVLLIINLAALAYLVYKLIKVGNRYQKAFQVAWNMIVAGSSNPDYCILMNIGWVPILAKTWWICMFLLATFWILFQEWYLWVAGLFLLVFHVIWYILGSKERPDGFDRILYLSSGWGIIYKTITADSELNTKSLAELDLRKKNLLVLAIERDQQMASFPKGTETLGIGDRLVIFGDLDASELILN